MHRNRSASAFSVAVLAGALAMTGCASAATKADAAGGTSAAMTTRAATAAGGTVHIIDYSINSDGPDFRVILTGAVGDYGPAVTVYPDGNVDPGHTSEMALKLTHGSFRLGIAGIHQKVISAFSHWPGNTSTCSGSISFTVPAPIVAGSGTGLYPGDQRQPQTDRHDR
jgi:hypothetical protein